MKNGRFMMSIVISPSAAPILYHVLRLIDIEYISSDPNYIEKFVLQFSIFMTTSYFITYLFGFPILYALNIINKLNSASIIISAVACGLIVGILFSLLQTTVIQNNGFGLSNMIYVSFICMLAALINSVAYCLAAFMSWRH